MSVSRVFSAIKQYWLLALSLVIGAAALVAEFGLELQTVAQVIIWVLCLGVALRKLVDIVATLREGKYGIDILAVTAIIATLAVGQYWASLLVVIMLTSGEALENYADRRARRELNALLDRAPRHAHVVTAEGLRDVPVDQVQPGDFVLIRPAEVVPVDGVVRDGQSAFDESSLTGESLPVERHIGDPVLSGSLNGRAAVTIEATADSEHSQYGQIIALVREAEANPAPFVRMADRYSVPFTIVSFALAFIAWAISGEVVRIAEVLVLATPCPLILGTPIAFISGMSRASKSGIIVKNGSALEQMASAKTVAFDKTGTLTGGAIELDRIETTADLSAEEVLAYAAAVERSSSHVLAGVIVAAADHAPGPVFDAEKVEEITGQGARALVKGVPVFVGKDPNADQSAADQTHSAVVVGGRLVGIIYFLDHPRPEAAETVAELRAAGVQDIMMLTGDNLATAKRVGEQVGVTTIKAGCLPADKVKALRDVVPSMRPAIMVGDGVNDAPVLAAADVGVAMGARGSTAASESADVVVMVDDLSRLGALSRIAKRTVVIARQSIFVGIGISLLLMVYATSGAIPALLGAGLQEVIDVVVIVNALRAHSGGRSDHRDRPAKVQAA